MPELLEKVTAFVVRRGAGGHELLLFEHESAGVQIPAGTVEPGEDPGGAVLREAREETGLTEFACQFLGSMDIRLPGEQRAIAVTTPVYTRPTSESADWARLRRGFRVREERRQADFVQVTYEESDSIERPTSISYRITGWVPEQTLVAVERRHFFLLLFQGTSPERWTVVDETHLFTLFWAPLEALPAIVQPQVPWLAMLPEGLRGAQEP
jgi:8-oxo-dGTP pyrophosphatase MutT (NUDIX family)